MSGRDRADRWSKRLARVNILMAAGMASLLGFVAWSSLACSDLTGPPKSMNRDDSLAVLAIFRENNLKTDNFRASTTVNSVGRVTSLYLTKKNITVLPQEIRELDDLRNLYLENNKLTTLPREMENLINLEILMLDSNQIDSLPDGMRFGNLKKVSLSGNRLRGLPMNFDVTSVEDLDLSKNQLASLPPDFRYLHNLVELNLEENLLDSLGFDFTLIKSLRILDLSHNRLASLPPTLLDLQPDFLDIASNRLCFHKQTDPDSATRRTIGWLDSLDRDWKSFQTCP